MTDEPVVAGAMSGHDNLRFPTTVVLKETDLVRKVANVVLVNRHRDGTFHHATVKLTKLKRTSKKQAWPVEPETYTLEGEEINVLHRFINRIPVLSQVPAGSDYVMISGSEGIKQLGTREGKALINLLLDAVRGGSLEGLLRLARLEAPILESLSAAVRHAQYKQALAEFIRLVEADASEPGDLQPWIKQNAWIFGTEYVETPLCRRISLHCEIDVLLSSVDGFNDVIELKRAGFPVLIFDPSHNCFYPSSELGQAIGQVANYLQKIEDYRLNIENEDRIAMLKPRGRIVIGRTTGWDKERHQALRKLNGSLSNIDIMTYDHLIRRGETLIRYYSITAKKSARASSEAESI